MKASEIDSMLEEDHTVSEVIDELSMEEAYTLFRGGKVDLDVNEPQEKVFLDGSAVNDVKERGDQEMHYKKRGLLTSFLIPFDVAFHDLPYRIGEKTAERNAGEQDAAASSILGMGATTVGTGTIIYDLTEYATEGLVNMPDMPDTVTATAGLGGLATGNMLKGRYHTVQEEVMEHYLQDLEEEAGNYTVETY